MIEEPFEGDGRLWWCKDKAGRCRWEGVGGSKVQLDQSWIPRSTSLQETR